MSAAWGIHWFRRDLRITGNKALREIWQKTDGRTIGVFCFDSSFLSRPDFSHNRFAFFLKTLQALKTEFTEMGGDLIVVNQLPFDFFSDLLKVVKIPPQFVSWNRDYEPFARQRDARIVELLASRGVEAITARDHLVFEPHEIKKDDKLGGFYQIYTPFSRKWFDQLKTPSGLSRISSETRLEKPSKKQSVVFRGSWKEYVPAKMRLKDRLDDFERENKKRVTISIPDAGFQIAYEQLMDFSKRISEYKENRDFPGIDGTSRLSMFLKNGSITSSQIIKTFKLEKLNLNIPSGPIQFLKEIIWREFYYHILFHRPDVEENSFNKNLQNIKWENRSDLFERWKEGATGFPIVDAGMRELRETGWMHNRVRMIVASFLVKDLLIDWRWGEKYFMQMLLDGDLASNNGGWQWAASTGCDPQPYFRIFNPWLQSKKFDPEGVYIKKFVPELKRAPIESLHDEGADRSQWKYPKPVVDHSVQKKKALMLYKKGG